MSADIVIVIDDKFYDLGIRWRNMMNIDSEHTCTKEEALEIIYRLYKEHERDILEYGYDNTIFYWLCVARAIIKSSQGGNVSFYSDEDGRYCNGYPGEVGITDTHKDSDCLDLFPKYNKTRNYYEIFRTGL